jgi:hypothetical protein
MTSIKPSQQLQKDPSGFASDLESPPVELIWIAERLSLTGNDPAPAGRAEDVHRVQCWEAQAECLRRRMQGRLIARAALAE